jgi:hypothetical protein
VFVPAPDSTLAPAILASLARERLSQFRRAVPDGRNRDVLELYLIDSELASQFHAEFRVVEVLLRETMHRALSGGFGARWFSDSKFRAALDPRTCAAIEEAVRAARSGTSTPPAGSVVAGIMLGTWVQLLAPGARRRQDAAIWKPVLATAFQRDLASGKTRTRIEVFELAQRVNWARNRVNHCEPVVFGFPLPGQLTADGERRRATPHQILDDTKALTAAMNLSVEEWLNIWANIDQLLADPRVASALAFKARDKGISLEGRR